MYRMLVTFLNVKSKSLLYKSMLYTVIYIPALKFLKVDSLFEFHSQNVTDEDKKKENQAMWTAWLKTYVERLKKEADKVTDLTAANQRRKEVMNMTNPR